jgi:hypothetical protein
MDSTRRLTRRLLAEDQDNILVVVHPGSLAGSLDFNIGTEPAREVRAGIAQEVADHKGPVYVVLGDLADEIDRYQDLSFILGDADQEFRAGPAQNDLQRVAQEILASVPMEARITVTGAWTEPEGGGCINCVVDALNAAGGQARASSKSAHLGESEGRTTTLAEIYSEGLPDQREIIWNYVGQRDFNLPLDVKTVDPTAIKAHKRPMTVLAAFEQYAEPEQHEIVDAWADDMRGGITDDHIILLWGDEVIDGNHRIVAAARAGVQLPAVDLMDLPG